MKQKLFTLLLAVAASVGTMFAWDYERVQIGDLYYNLDATNQTAEVTSQNSSYPRWSTTITTAIIPAFVTYNKVTYSVTSIGNSAFSDCSGLTSVTIGNSVTSIGINAFWHCSGLTSVTIPSSVTSIGINAFRGCTGLTSVTIPNSVTSIGYCAFHECRSLTSVTIPNSVTSIGDFAFYYCTGLTSVIVENGNTVYDSRDNCNAIIETATNTLIAGCKNTTIPNSVTSIGNCAFEGCTGLTSLTIPNSVTSIGEYAFYGCTGLTSVTIPNSVTSIEYAAFSSCTGLTSLTIPNSVTSIGSWAFVSCSGLTSITCEATTPPTLGSSVFMDVDKSIPLYVPAQSVDLYKAADQWKEFNIQPISYYTITWANWDGTTLKTEQIIIGIVPHRQDRLLQSIPINLKAGNLRLYPLRAMQYTLLILIVL